ncbi:MAG: TIGR02281 family clan AA aspartic protease [Gammaproteobacteria bacterium]|nr:TIGR02281 family clan AA aspartic protease [Gammaproteobacteria bacterium]
MDAIQTASGVRRLDNENPIPPPAGQKLGRYMMVVFWVIVLGFATFGAQRWLERSRNLNADVSSTVLDGRRSVQLKGDRWGHYSVTVLINGEPVRALVDTGATEISVPAAVADRLALQPGRQQQAMTANGMVLVNATTLDTVTIGELGSRNVSATINRHLPGNEILLGMSFLRDFDITIRGDLMTLTER